MIYLDNAATTYPKPPQVINAVQTAMRQYGANPGRSGHALSLAAATEIYRCRVSAADFFHAPGPECVAFTLNCTHAANMVLKGLLKPGDHVVVSCLEHNAVMRPLKELEKTGVTYTAAQVYPGDNDRTLQSFRESINAKTVLVACMHASNVWGVKLPVARIAALAREYGLQTMVDVAQTAGAVPIDMEDWGVDYICAAGHKGLYGPMGTGMLITARGEELKTILEGGTGTNSISFEQPSSMPDRFESGTPNMPGIAGLHAGIEYVKRVGMERMERHEMQLIQHLYDRLSRMKGIELYMPRPDSQYFVPLLSFNLEGKDSELVAEALDKRGIAVRAGLHCAPAAHQFCHTMERGAVRVCPSAFSKMTEIDALCTAILKIL